MKRWIYYPLVSVLAFSIGGLGSYLIHGVVNPNSNNTGSTGGDIGNNSNDYPDISFPEDEDKLTFSKMATKIVSTQEVLSSNLSFQFSKTGMNDVSLEFSNVDIDISDFLTSTDLSDLKLRATLNVHYETIHEEIGFILENSNLYLTYDNTNFSFYAPDTIAGIFPILNALGIELPNFSDIAGGIFDNIDIGMLAEKAMEMGQSSIVTPTTLGVDYTLDLSTIFDLFDLPVTLGNCKLVLSSDNDNNLIGISTIGEGLIINDEYKVAFSASDITLNVASSYQQLTDAEKGIYQDMTTTTRNLFTSLAQLMEKKNFAANYEISLVDEKGRIPQQELKGLIQGDLSTIKTDFARGTYEIGMNHYSSGVLSNTVYGLYRDQNIYLQLNNLLKGKMSNQTINDLSIRISQEFEANGIPLNPAILLEMINQFISSLNFDAIIQGDINSIKSYIKSFVFLPNGIEMVVNANLVNLGDYDVGIKIEDVTNSSSYGFKVSLSGLHYQDYIFNTSLNVKPQDQITLSKSEDELKSFKDYQGIVPIFDTISSLINKRKFNANYSMNISNKDGTLLQGSGNLSADFSSFDLNNSEKNYGDYELSLQTQVAGVNHEIVANYQENDLYFTLDKFMKQKISNQGMGSLFDTINNILQDNNVDSSFDGVNELLQYFSSSQFIDHLFGKIDDDFSLTHLEEILKIDEDNIDPNKLIIDLNLPFIFEETIYKDKVKAIKLILDTDTECLTQIEIQNLCYQDYKIDFVLGLEKEFTEFTLTDEEKAFYYDMSNVGNIINGLYSLPTELTMFGLELSGSINHVDSLTKQENELLSLSGQAQVDNSIQGAPNLGGEIHLYQPNGTEVPTDHQVLFEYSGDKNNGQTIAEYRSLDEKHPNPNTMHLLLQNKDIFSIYDRIQAVAKDENNLLYQYLKDYFGVVQSMSTGIPVLDAFAHKDLSIISDEYFKEIRITDQALYLEFSTALLDETDKSGRTNQLEFRFDENDKLSSVSLNGYYSSCHISVEVALSQYDETRLPELMEYNDETKDYFIDAHGFDILANCLITTTEHSFFDLSGQFSLNMSLFSWNLSSLVTYITCYVSIQDQQVAAYLSFNNSSLDATYWKNNGFRGVEFFVKEDIAYTIKTSTVEKKEGSIFNQKKYSESTIEIRKLTQQELLKNIIYYVLSYVMNIESLKVNVIFTINAGEIVLGNIYGSMNEPSDPSSSNSVTISHNYSSVLDSAVYDETNRTFIMKAYLGNLISLNNGLVKFDPNEGKPGLEIGVAYDENFELSKFDLNVDINAVSLIDVHASLNLKRTIMGGRENDSAHKEQCMARFNKVVGLIENDENLRNMDYYVIQSITANTHNLYKYSGINVIDNGAYWSTTVSSKDTDVNNSPYKDYFYHE